MKKETHAAQGIMESMQEAIEFAKGSKTGGRITYIFNNQEICPKEIRKSLHLTREQFHEWFICKVSNQRNWEKGLRTPNEVTLAFYAMIKENASQVYKMLHHKPIPNVN